MRTAAKALRYWRLRQNVLSNNLANAGSKGFKGEEVFARMLENGETTFDSGADLAPGQIEQTGRSLDVALEGRGFLVVRTDTGPRLTRGGSLELEKTGRLVDQGGNPVLGEGGRPLTLPPGSVEIDPGGRISVDGQDVGRLRVVRAGPDARLEQEAGTRFRVAEGEAVRVEPEERTVRQGALESSNVEPVESMVDLISIQQSHAASVRSLETLDGVMDTVVNRLARPM